MKGMEDWNDSIKCMNGMNEINEGMTDWIKWMNGSGIPMKFCVEVNFINNAVLQVNAKECPGNTKIVK